MWREIGGGESGFATPDPVNIEFSNHTTGLQPRWMQRHAVAFTKGLPGAKKIRNIMHGAPTPEAFADGISSFLAGKPAE